VNQECSSSRNPIKKPRKAAAPLREGGRNQALFDLTNQKMAKANQDEIMGSSAMELIPPWTFSS